MRRLHRFVYHGKQSLAQRRYICFVAQDDAERLKRARHVVLPAIEAAMNVRLYPIAQRPQQRHDQERCSDQYDWLLRPPVVRDAA